MRSSGGPCDHCGTRQTPCWRKGPPGKDTLCNACGARYIVKKSLVGYLPGTSGGGPKTQMLAYTAKPRGKQQTRKPRSSGYTVLQDQRPAPQRRGAVSKRTQNLSPAAQATFAQLKLLTQLEQSVVRLASAASQPPLFQPPPGQQPAASLQVLLQRNGATPSVLGGPAPQLTVLPGINIQIKSLKPAKASLFTDGAASLRRRQRKCDSPSRAAT